MSVGEELTIRPTDRRTVSDRHLPPSEFIECLPAGRSKAERISGFGWIPPSAERSNNVLSDATNRPHHPLRFETDVPRIDRDGSRSSISTLEIITKLKVGQLVESVAIQTTSAAKTQIGSATLWVR
jgi:hypothetical protein